MGLGLAGCAGEQGGRDGFTNAEWAVVQSLSPLPELPPDPTNRVADDPRAAALGQMLFFEPGYSGPLAVGDDGENGGLGAVGDTGKVSCASCHMPRSWFDDTRSNPDGTSLGADWGTRNAPSLVNAAFYSWFDWDGKRDTLWSQAVGPPENPKSHNGDRLRVAHVMFDKYRADYDALFDPDLDPALDPASADAARFPPSGRPKKAAADPDGAWERMAAADRAAVNRVYANFGKAVAAYERKLVSRDAPFDRYVAGDTAAIPEQAKDGLRYFIGEANCVACHDTPLLSDGSFHNTGVPQTGPHVPAVDNGRYDAVATLLASPWNSAGAFSDDPHTGKLDGVAQADGDKGKFRTKHLRQIARTAPYMHTGQLATLADVVTFYKDGGGQGGFAGVKDSAIKPLRLSDEDVAAIVAFLETLTGAPIPADLTADTSRH